MRPYYRFIRFLTLYFAIILGGIFFVSGQAHAGTITVSTNVDTNTRDTVMTYREALLLSNGTLTFASLTATEQGFVSGSVGSGIADTINFNIVTASKIITVTASTPEPAITDGSTTIDGYTQSGTSVNTNSTGALNTVLVVELNGSNASTGSLITFSSSNNVVKGLVIRNARLFGITSTAGANSNKVQGNFIGMTLAGTTAAANLSGGVNVTGCSGWYIGTDGDGSNDAAERNLISGNTNNGVTITTTSSSNVVAGNIIGLDKVGTTDRGNTTSGIRILVTSDSNRIGTNGDGVSDDIERNVISGNTSVQVYVNNSDSTIIAGNYMGTQVNGTSISGLTSGGSCVRLESGADNTIIGTNGSNDANNTNERNILSGCSEHGVAMDLSAPTGNIVAGNYIGTDITGTIDLGNAGRGISVAGGTLNLRIGTDGNGVADADEGNLISGNTSQGILLIGASNNAVIAGNKIGTNAAGTAALPNSSHGIGTDSSTGIRIGTNGDGVSDSLERNIISGNNGDARGIVLATTSNNAIIAGNYIGVDVNGTADLGNILQGILITGGTTGVRVGTNGDGVNDSAERNIISGNEASGILIDGADSNIIAGNYIGTDVTGSVAIPNTSSSGFGGVEIVNGSDSNIVGTNGSNDIFNANERNVLSGNVQAGVIMYNTVTGNVVAGNYIGLNAAGTAAIPNGSQGIDLNTAATNIRVGTNGDGIADTDERNVISGNTWSGIAMYSNAASVTIAGNYFGLNAAGTAAIANGVDGVNIQNSDNIIVGTNGDGNGDSVEGNVISGNTNDGVEFVIGADNNTLAGNIIGLNAAGTAAIPNASVGVYVETSDGTIIGTDGDGVGDSLEGNVISGNTIIGIKIREASNTVIAGNIIGLNASANAAIPNISNGIELSANTGAWTNTRIGTNDDGVSDVLERNIVSGNGNAGIYMYDQNGTTASTGTVVAGNYIGTNGIGLSALGNSGDGIDVFDYVQGTIIGFDGTGDPNVERNLIVGSGWAGVYMWNSAAYSNSTIVSSNYIGVGVDGTTALGNYVGVFIDTFVNGTTIGGSTLAQGNIIANSTGDGGVEIMNDPTAPQTDNNLISHNSIFGNFDMAIDITNNTATYEADGSTPNDVGDGDTGANQGMNFPVITSVTADGVNITVNGTLDTSSASTASVEVYLTNGFVHASGHGDLLTFLGLATPTNNAPGNWSLVVANSELNPRISAIAIDAAGNTSEAACTWPYSAPSPITDLSATGLDGHVPLTWTSPNDGCDPITDYVIEYGLTAGFPGNAIVFSDGVSATTGANVTGLTDNVSYSFRVFAVNNTGTSLTSNVVAVMPVGIPDPVNDLVATPSDTQLVLTWSAPAGSVTDYTVQCGATSGFPGNATTFDDGISTLTTAIVTGLTNETSYSCRVYAENNVGTSPTSNVVVTTPNTATWVLNTTDTLDFDQDGSAITNPSGTIELYGVSFGGQDSNQRAIFDPNASPGSRWTTSTVFANRFGSGNAVFYNGLNYAFGQNTTTFSSQQVYSFVPDGGAVTSLTAPVVVPHHEEMRYALVGGFVYALAGYQSTVQNFSDVFRYEIATDTWVTTGLAPIPGSARRQGVAEAMNSVVYYVGGDTSPGTQSGGGGTATVTGRMDVYNPATDTWDSTKAAMPVGRAESCSEVYDGLLYVISGRGVTSVRQEVLRYDPTYDQWSKAASLTVQRKLCSAAVTQNQLYTFFGGLQQSGATTHNDFETMSVANGAPYLPTNLFVDETNAQSGGHNPTAVTSGTPVFSAICNDPNWSDRLNQYRIQVDDNNDFSSVVWDSGIAGTSMPDCRQGVRSADIAFGGTPLVLDGSTYYWRIKFWDDAGAEGPFSEATTATNRFTLINVNDVPTAPTSLFVNNSNAQLGATNPTGIVSTTPVFSAICNDLDTGDILNQYRIQVDDNNDFSSVVWDSGAAGTSMANCVAGDRSQNITFGSAPLALDGTTYYWRIKFWDDEPSEGVFSESPLSTNTFTMQSPTSLGGGSSVQRIEQLNQDNQQQVQEEQQPPMITLAAPIIGPVTVVSPSAIRFEWSYADTSSVLGYRLLNNQNQLLIQVANPTGVAATEDGLPHNTLIAGHRVAAYNSDGQGFPSETYPDAYTFMILVTPKLVSRVGSNMKVAIKETVNNLTTGQSGLQFELITLAQPNAAGVMQSPWVTQSSYEFTGIDPQTSYLLRSRGRNANAIETEWSSTIDVGTQEVQPGKPNLKVSLSVASNDGQPIDQPLNPNSLLSVSMTVVNEGEGEASNVLLTLPIPDLITYIPGTLSIDGQRQSDGADGDAGQTGNGAVAAIWKSLVLGFGHTVHLELGFNTVRLIELLSTQDANDVLAQAIAAANPQIILQAQASHSDDFTPVFSNQQQVQPDMLALAPTPAPTPEPQPQPAPVPTPEQTQIINQVLQQEFPQPGVTSSQPPLPQGETTTSLDGGSFNVSTTSGDNQLTLSGSARANGDQIEFMGTTSAPYAVVTLIFNDAITVIAVSDANGNWQTFVSAEQLGIHEGEQKDIRIEAIAATSDLRSDRVQVASLTLSRARSGQVFADFATIVSDQGFISIINEAAKVIEKQEPAIQTTLTVSAPVIVASSVPLWGYLPYVPTLIYHFIGWIFGFLGRRKKKDEEQASFGVVYDAITKLPLPLAIVRIYEKATKKLVSTTVTDKYGRYDVLLRPGMYAVEVNKPQYQFPSSIVITPIDGQYDRVYQDKVGVTIIAQSMSLPHIPIDPINAHRQWQLSFGLRKWWMAFQILGNHIATPIMIVGFVMGIALVYSVPTRPANWVILGLYSVTLAMQLKLKPKLIKAWGVVYDLASDAILPLVAIQLIEPAGSKVVASRLSDYDGRFTFLPEPGMYVVKASKPGYNQVTEVVQGYSDRQQLPQQVHIEKLNQRISGDVAMKQTS